MKYIPSGETFRDIARRYTTGGEDYADILSAMNLGNGADTRPPAGVPIDIPDEWATTEATVILAPTSHKIAAIVGLVILAKLLLG